jgi:hypothetical protein
MSPLFVRRGLVAGVAVLILLATFSLYARPELMMKLANHLWACF